MIQVGINDLSRSGGICRHHQEVVHEGVDENVSVRNDFDAVASFSLGKQVRAFEAQGLNNLWYQSGHCFPVLN